MPSHPNKPIDPNAAPKIMKIEENANDIFISRGMVLMLSYCPRAIAKYIKIVEYAIMKICKSALAASSISSSIDLSRFQKHLWFVNFSS